MRVLLAAKFVPTGPNPIGGVQTWVATVRRELERRGYEVAEWQPGFRDPKPADLGIFAHLSLTGHLSGHCDRLVAVCHGIIRPEQPLPADKRFFVSENVRGYWSCGGEILRQPIDLTFWTPPGPEAERKGAVRFSYRRSKTRCADAAEALGLDLSYVRNASAEGARYALQRASLVFASGRAALEAMACGAPVVIYDNRSAYQAPLMDTDLQRQMEHSYSGRGGIRPALHDLVEAGRLARPSRDWVEQHHDVRAICDRLLAA